MSRRKRVAIDPHGYSGSGGVIAHEGVWLGMAWLRPGTLTPTWADSRQAAAAYRANMRARAALPLSAASKPEAMVGHGNDRDRGA